MAVPFRGKDTPMERADFGHPDVAIVLNSPFLLLFWIGNEAGERSD